MKWYTKKQPRGYITLMGVLIVGGVSTIISLSLALLGTDFLRTNQTLTDSTRARAMANACAEDALQAMRDFPTSTTHGSLSIGSESCAYDIAPLQNDTYAAYVFGSAASVSKKLEVVFTSVSSTVELTQWHEVADFNY